MTGAQLVTEIKRHVGNRASTEFDTTWFVERLNEAYQRLAVFRDPETGRVLRFPQFFDRKKARVIAAAPADNFVANQANVYAMLGIWNVTDGREVKRKSQRALLRRDPADAGPILHWAPYGQGNAAGYLIWKKPTVNTTIDEFVYNYPETLANNATAPIIDADWHECIHLIGGSLAAGLMDMYDKQSQLAARALAFVRSHPTPGEEVQSGGGRYLRVM